MTNLKAADGHAPTIKGGAAAATSRPEVRQTQSSTKESEDLRTTLTKAKQQQLDDFLDLNLGTQDERDYQRYVSKWELYSKLFLTIAFQTGLCFFFFCFFVFVRPAKNRNPRNDRYTTCETYVNGTQIDPDCDPYVRGHRTPAGWPSIGGASIALTVIGTATTFLLVFSLSWTFNRWREARDLVGKTMSTLREYYIYMGTNFMSVSDKVETLEEKKAMHDLKTSLLWFGAMLIIYMDANKEKSEKKQTWFKAIVSFLYDKPSMALALLVLRCKGKTPEVSIADTFSKQKIEDLDAQPGRKLSDIKGRNFNADHMKQEVIKAHVKIRKQYLKIQMFTGKDDKGIATDLTVIPCGMHTRLLQNFYAMDKFKTVGMPKLIKSLLWVLTYCYTCFIFPVLMPYTFVMTLDPYAAEKRIFLRSSWYSGYFVIVFVVSTTLVLTYFNALFSIQQELEDPFGDDFSDIKLRKLFLTPFLKDMEVIYDALQKKGSNATANKLVPIFDSEKPLVHVDSQTPLGDGETEEPENRATEVLMPAAAVPK